MAVTRLLHLKQSEKSFPSGSLWRCIHYIFNREKTEDGLWTGGNCGSSAGEIYHSMMETKQCWNKMDGRQGYHFIVSFEKGETDEETAYQVLKEWCGEYFKDNYEYAFAIHNDKEHMHGHIVFNSVSRTSGYKYRYEKGDWEKLIQPVTDRVCERHGLHPLTYEKPRVGKDYAEHMAEKEGRQTWKKIIRKDLDYAISRSGSYEEVLDFLRRMDYRIRSGTSEKHGAYLTLHPPGAERGRRTYQLGRGYGIDDIRYRVAHPEEEKIFRTVPRLRWGGSIVPNEKGTFRYSRYQLRAVRRCYRATHYHFLNPYRVSQAQARKDALRVEKLSSGCRYLIQHHITTDRELKERLSVLQNRERELKNTQEAWSREEQKVSREYQKLSEMLHDTSLKDDAFETLLDRMEELEAEYPDSVLNGWREGRNGEISALREEKKLIRFLLRETEKEKSIQKIPLQEKEVQKIATERRR